MRRTGAQAIERLEQRVVERLEGIDKQFLEVARRFDAVDRQFGALDTKLEELRGEMHGQFDAVYQRLDRLEIEYHMLVVGIRRIEEQMAEDREDRARLIAQVTDLRERVKELEARLKELQARLDEEDRSAPPSKPS